MPGRSAAALDIEAPEQQLAQRAIKLEADWFQAVIEPHEHALAEVYGLHFARQHELELEDAVQRGDALLVVRVDGERSAAATAERRAWQLARAARHFQRSEERRVGKEGRSRGCPRA